MSMPKTRPTPVVTVPWTPGRRRSTPLRDAAEPLLVPALRRLAQEPAAWHRPEEMDKGRATLRRLAHIASWQRLHDPRPDEGLAWLPHVGPVLRGVGLVPSRVAEVLVACRLAGTRAGTVADETLMTVAHLSLFDAIDPVDMHLMVRDAGWTPQDLLSWSLQFPSGHLSACEDLRLSHATLRERLRAGTAPSTSQVALMAVMRAPVPGIAPPVR